MNRKIAITLGILAVYMLLGRVPVPGLNSDVIWELGSGNPLFGLNWGSIRALGIVPFVTGFVLVELFSLTPLGRRARRGGMAGRQRLTGWAIKLSMLICTIQAVGAVTAMEPMTGPGGAPLMPNSGLLTKLVIVLTLVAASTMLFFLFRMITEHGIGNGFCLLLIFDFVFSAAGLSLAEDLRSGGSPNNFVLSLMTAVLAIFLIRDVRSYGASSADPNPPTIALPTFPQGLTPVMWAYTLVLYPSLLGTLWRPESEVFHFPPMLHVTLTVVATVLLSWCTVHFFSTRKRIESNLPDITPKGDFEAILKGRLVLTTIALVAAVAAFWAVENYAYSGPNPLGIVAMMMFVAIGVDLVEEIRFHSRHPKVATLAQLDNVHLALYVRSALNARGIDCAVKTLHYRSLFFFFAPLYKMVVLVPEDDLEESREAWDSLGARVV